MGVSELPRRTDAKRLRSASLLRMGLAGAGLAEGGAGEAHCIGLTITRLASCSSSSLTA